MQDAGKLVQLFLKLHAEKYGKRPTVNIFKEKYAMKDVIESVGFERAEELLRYYFKTARHSHPLDWFKYNFEKLEAIVIELTEDEKKRAEMRAETKRRVEEWKAKNESRN